MSQDDYLSPESMKEGSRSGKVAQPAPNSRSPLFGSVGEICSQEEPMPFNSKMNVLKFNKQKRIRA